jgi:hypothetical protein
MMVKQNGLRDPTPKKEGLYAESVCPNRMVKSAGASRQASLHSCYGIVYLASLAGFSKVLLMAALRNCGSSVH